MEAEMQTAPKLKRVTRIDSIPAGSTYFNEQGFLHDTPIVTSIGIFEYGLPDGTTRRELRLPEHVFDKASLASYAGKPVIITHEAGEITKNNVMKEIVGTILSEGYQDGDDVRCKIVIHDIDKVKQTPYRELSLGYSLDLIEEPGEWNGERYDAIQTNIRINHLAIVESARAGEQAHLNLDGKKVELDDKKPNKEVKKMSKTTVTRGDSVAMTPEELVAAINQYKASKGAGAEEAPKDPAVEDGVGTEPGNEAGAEATPTQTEAPVEAPTVPEVPAQPEAEAEKKDDDGTQKLIGVLEELLAELKGGVAPATETNGDCGTGECAKPEGNGDNADNADNSDNKDNADNSDSSNDKSGSMNADSADEVFRQRLSICRIGDKLHMDGLEDMSIKEAKLAVIAKVHPDMRMDGKAMAYIDAAYDLAVAEVNKKKDVNFQRQQMAGTPAPAQQRADGQDEGGALGARKRMIAREGGNK